MYLGFEFVFWLVFLGLLVCLLIICFFSCLSCLFWLWSLNLWIIVLAFFFDLRSTFYGIYDIRLFCLICSEMELVFAYNSFSWNAYSTAVSFLLKLFSFFIFLCFLLYYFTVLVVIDYECMFSFSTCSIMSVCFALIYWCLKLFTFWLWS